MVPKPSPPGRGETHAEPPPRLGHPPKALLTGGDELLGNIKPDREERAVILNQFGNLLLELTLPPLKGVGFSVQ